MFITFKAGLLTVVATFLFLALTLCDIEEAMANRVSICLLFMETE
jgi:hypothetical protein